MVLAFILSFKNHYLIINDKLKSFLLENKMKLIIKLKIEKLNEKIFR
jgi:hypothetical protein